jgi:hypothetical protein
MEQRSLTTHTTFRPITYVPTALCLHLAQQIRARQTRARSARTLTVSFLSMLQVRAAQRRAMMAKFAQRVTEKKEGQARKKTLKLEEDEINAVFRAPNKVSHK